MTSFFKIVHPVFGPAKSKATALASVLDTKESKKAAVTSKAIINNKETLEAVLDRAASDPAFIAQLTHQGSKALQDYDLTSEEKAALLSGDINWIESHIGKLDDRLKQWLLCRLQQEIW